MSEPSATAHLPLAVRADKVALVVVGCRNGVELVKVRECGGGGARGNVEELLGAAHGVFDVLGHLLAGLRAAAEV